MFPTVTLTPRLAELDKKIAPLVETIHSLQLRTFYSCEGHGFSSKTPQSAAPMIVICPEESTKGSVCFLRFVGMLATHNGNSRETHAVKWNLQPKDGFVFLRPAHPETYELAHMHEAIDILTTNLCSITKWYMFGKK